MQCDEILEHYGELIKLALKKTANQQDAEDLVSDTMLAAFVAIRRGDEIKYPKTWLANTLMHKFNDGLRKKYGGPVIVNLDTAAAITVEDGFDTIEQSAEAAELRRQILFLSKQTREMVIRYYYHGQSIAKIAAALNVPEGTVKRRLSVSRENIRKGLESMTANKNHLPGNLWVSNCGSCGPKGEPTSIVETDLIAQNLLYLAYEKPLSMTELAEKICIPTAYIEPIVTKLVNGELMVKTSGDKYYTDFLIRHLDDHINTYEAQKAFVEARFDGFWKIVSSAVCEVRALEYYSTLSLRKQKKLERYVIFRILQNFEVYGYDIMMPTCPNRRDGGQWIATGYYYPAGFDENAFEEVSKFMIVGGHRTHSPSENTLEDVNLTMCEFDTKDWDCPHRFTACGWDNYFSDGFFKFLWSIHSEKEPCQPDVNSAIIAGIPKLEEYGILATEAGKLTLDIPVIERSVFDCINGIIDRGYMTMKEKYGAELAEMVKGAKLSLTPYTKSIPENFKFAHSADRIAAVVCSIAYERGLYMKDVHFCCPAVVLVYRKKQS